MTKLSVGAGLRSYSLWRAIRAATICSISSSRRRGRHTVNMVRAYSSVWSRPGTASTAYAWNSTASSSMRAASLKKAG